MVSTRVVRSPLETAGGKLTPPPQGPHPAYTHDEWDLIVSYDDLPNSGGKTA